MDKTTKTDEEVFEEIFEEAKPTSDVEEEKPTDEVDESPTEEQPEVPTNEDESEQERETGDEEEEHPTDASQVQDEQLQKLEQKYKTLQGMYNKTIRELQEIQQSKTGEPNVEDEPDTREATAS
jgi:hypothetical protein